VNRKLQIIIGLAAMAVIGICLALLGLMRVHETRQFSQSYRLQSDTGTNYVVQLLETTVGKVDTGHVVIVYARFENPNPTEVVLKREWFVLVDHDKDYYLPTTSGTQTPLIKLPPNGVLEKEALSYAVGDDSFAGTIGLEIGHHYFVLIKNQKPWKQKLHQGHFVTFHGRDW
jgi:hypothetical protein